MRCLRCPWLTNCRKTHPRLGIKKSGPPSTQFTRSVDQDLTQPSNLFGLFYEERQLRQRITAGIDFCLAREVAVPATEYHFQQIFDLIEPNHFQIDSSLHRPSLARFSTIPPVNS